MIRGWIGSWLGKVASQTGAGDREAAWMPDVMQCDGEKKDA